MEPHWENIERARNETAQFLLSHKISDDIANAIIMVCSELIENAVKYGYFKEKEATISVNIELFKKYILVEVRNSIKDAKNQHFKKLDKTIQWIRGYQNPLEAYTMKIKEVAKKDLFDEESGLGLIRVAYEGESILDFYLENINIVAVSAIRHFNIN